MADVPPRTEARTQGLAEMESARSYDADNRGAATSTEQEQEEAGKEGTNASTGARRPKTVTYCSTGVQTTPPKNAQEFRDIHGRELTELEIVSRMGTAAIGRFGAGPVANPHEVVHSVPFSSHGDLGVTISYADASFQTTTDVAQCNMSIARAKVKASMMVNKQRIAAQKAGYRVWSETQDGKIIHSEQYPVRVQFDKDGNATSGDVGGVLLPNIYGEEIAPQLPSNKPIVQAQRQELPQRSISFSKEVDAAVYTSTSGLTPPPTPPPAPLDDDAHDRLHPRQIHTFAPSILKQKFEPWPLEDYGYIRQAPRSNPNKDAETADGTLPDEVAGDAQQNEETNKQDKTMLEVGGERFADRFIVYDPTWPAPATPTPSSTVVSTASKKRKAIQSEHHSSNSPPKRPKISDVHSNPGSPFYTQHGRNDTARFVATESIAALPNSETEPPQTSYHNLAEKKAVAEERSGRQEQKSRDAKEDGEATVRGSRRRNRSQSAHRTSTNHRAREEMRSDWDRRRSRSPGDRKHRSDYRSRSRARHEEEDPYEVERQRHADERKKTEADKVAREAEQRRQKEEQERKQALEAEERQRKKEEERARARIREAEERRRLEQGELRKFEEAKYRRRVELEEKRKAREAEEQRRQEEKEQDHQRRRNADRERSPDRRKDKERRKVDTSTKEPEEPEDPYAKAREEEERKRKAAQQKHFSEKSTRRARERSVERAKEPRNDHKKHQDHDEPKTEEKKASRLRPRKPRQPFQLYVPPAGRR
jgi:hypothetical protein